jgi:hypothetical protein
MMAAHGEQGRRRPWHAVVRFEEAEEGRKEEEDESKRARECAGLNRRRRRAGARHGKRQAVAGAAPSSQKRNRRGSKVGCIQGLFCNYRKYRDLIVNQVFPLF